MTATTPRGANEFDGVTIYEKSVEDRGSSRTATPTDPEARRHIPAHLLRRVLPALAQVTEPEIVRHYTRLSQRNHNVDTGLYPLGSCTMKYNPKVNDRVAALPGFAELHPLQDPSDCQGMLAVLWKLQQALAELAGLRGVTLQPAAGAHGELLGLMIMRAWHEQRLRDGKIDGVPRYVLIPDTAHGTNPASVTMAGFATLAVRSDERGGMDLDDVLSKVQSHDIAGLMLTNPNTLGLFDENITAIARLVHRAGGLLYYDGANFNAIMGKVRPGDMGFDIVHFNTHKSFSTPHGGGGPGAGPVAVRDTLLPFLPVPRIERVDDGSFTVVDEAELSVGRIRSFHGNVGVLVRAWGYLRMLGRDGLERASELAVLNANYVQARIASRYEPLYGRRCMHEFVVSAAGLKRSYDVRALDVAKRLIDYGYHPPTVYFPLLIDEALMIEPTESETRATLDAFADAMVAIADEAAVDADTVRTAPHTAPVGRLDEARAARDLILRYERPSSMMTAAAPADSPAGAPVTA